MRKKNAYRGMMVLLLAGRLAIAVPAETLHANQGLKPNGAVHLQVKNCLFYVMDDVVLNVLSLDGPRPVTRRRGGSFPGRPIGMCVRSAMCRPLPA